MSDKVVALVLVPVVVIIFSFIFWRKATIFLMYWVLVLGAVRKWFFPGQADLVFFSSHLILTGIYLRFFLSGYRILKGSPALILLMASLIGWGFLSLLNLRMPDIRIGILGIVIHFYFIPLMFIIPRVFRTRKELIRFLERYALFSAPLLILGIIQYFSPLDSPLNFYVSETMSISTIGQYPRITSTFSYISGYAAYLNFLFMILLYLLSAKKIPAFFKIALPVLIVLTVINLFMSGSRGPVGISILSAMLYVVIASRLGLVFFGKVFSQIIVILGILLFVINTNFAARESYDAFMERARTTEDAIPRIIDTFTPFKFLPAAGLFGYGIGTTYQATQRFEIDWKDMPRGFEEEPERILLELGLIGYLLVYLLRLVIIFLFWKLFKRLRHINLKLLALCSLLFQLQFIHFNNLVFNLTSGIFYWFFVGFLFLLPKLDKRRVHVLAPEGSDLPSG